MAKILIVDDNKLFCNMLQDVAHKMEHEVTSVHLLNEGLRLARSGDYDIVFLGAKMPDGSSLDALPKILASSSSPEVIVISDAGIPDEAEEAIKMGAWDYIDRPSQDAMALPLVRALQYRAKKVPARPDTTLKKETFEGIIGESPQIKTCLEVVAQAADSDASVLITGETGTGKELFAWAIHNNSARSGKNFVIVDCAALPETLVESTLFGHEKGAFTGAEKGRDGLISQANKGTLFLDEVGELPRSIQKTFLRVLEEHRFRPVGSKFEMKSDFRLIAASNRDLDNMVQQKSFRKDLLFRLRSFSIDLPPLRERIQDIEDLVQHFTEQLCQEYGTEKKQFSPEFFNVLAKYNWPGNVRELVKSLESAIVTARDEPMLYPMHLPNELRAKVVRSSVSEDTNSSQEILKGLHRKRQYPRLQDVRNAALAEVEERYLRELLSTTEGDVKRACQISGLRRSRLYELLKKYDISRRF
jgi:two-component system NtrC family response regulator